MKRENRLRKNYDFQRIINSRKSVVSKFLVIYYLPNSEQKNRVGISISKKFANAVGRNKVRRQVRSILDAHYKFDKPLDMVIMVRKPFINSEFTKKEEEFKKILERI